MQNPVKQYRQIIIGVLKEYYEIPSFGVSSEELEEQLIIDEQNDHYQILTIGWEHGKRVYYPVFHVDIKNEKIWIQEDATDFDFVGRLEDKGVKASDIVLAFQSPIKRPYTGYAVM
jgi:XisI protein